MDTRCKIPKGGMHFTLAVQTRLVSKYGGSDANEEVALSAFAKSGMATMLFAVVTDDQFARRKSLA